MAVKSECAVAGATLESEANGGQEGSQQGSIGRVSASAGASHFKKPAAMD